MSSDNVETVRAVFAAVSALDEEDLLRYLDPDVRWHPTAFLTGDADFSGHEGVREWLGQLRAMSASGTDVVTFTSEFEDLGDGRVLVLGDGKIVREAGPLKQELGWIWRVNDDGKVVEMSNYLTREEARRVADEGGV